ncbi:hypothetical protein BCU68_07250 [Vibrio sp. 10N.286.49.B3]|uniref:PilW family protein n=1 Tax=Vibrio sp. 10N.286.49.B3 TaxID=1880855 RepID=UPI000C858E76|nr:prepilin-type N-terminal cleavage/methylation domain-containing protein [Vibrio sp. 10N.286.49.B3]PMH39886.1 hypothetical protein BCU68_07250 [Vibrio sp. 10N.286.49.B3]
MRAARGTSQQQGFTLVELILTIIVGGVLVLGIAGFVELGTRGFIDSVDRQRIQTQAQFTIEKMTRELRHAVPNSIEVEILAGQPCISFYPIVYSGFYAEIGSDIQFLIGSDSLADDNILPADLTLVINPTRQEDLIDSDYIHPVGDLQAEDLIYTLENTSLKGRSIADRHYIFDEKVKYCLTGQELSRQVDSSNDFITVADSITSADFTYTPPELHKAGLVSLSFVFTQQDESSNYQQDVQVFNVP